MKKQTPLTKAPKPPQTKAAPARPLRTLSPREHLARARTREEFVQLAIDLLGGQGPASERFGVTRAVCWQWATNSLPMEGAVVLAEALEIPYEVAIKWATRRLGTRPRRRTPKAAPRAKAA